MALVDVDLGAECGLQVAERLSAAAPDLHVGLLTSRWDLVPMRTARAAGARGVIAKDRPARALLAAVQELAAGGACEPDPAVAGEIRFVPREREILRLVGAGLTNAEIGASLYLAPGTIKHHMLGLYDKLGAPNRAAAVHAARRLGVLADHRVETRRAGRERTASGQLRVLVADTDDVRRAGVLLALHGRPWVEACSGVRRGEDALAAAARLRPDVAVAADPALSRALAAAQPGLRTLLLRDDEGCSHADLIAAGAAGAVRQWWTGERLADAVHRACRGPRDAGGSSIATGASSPDPVTPREREVLSAFATGATNPAIARRARALAQHRQAARLLDLPQARRPQSRGGRAAGRRAGVAGGVAPPATRAASSRSARRWRCRRRRRRRRRCRDQHLGTERELDRVGAHAGERQRRVREHVGELVHAVLAQVEHRVAPLVVARVSLDAGLAAVAIHRRRRSVAGVPFICARVLIPSAPV